MSAGRQLAFIWGAAAIGLVALSPWGPELASGLPACPFRSLLGVPCLACGTARAALALARLDVAGALALNPLAALSWMAFVAGGIVFGLRGLGGSPVPGLGWQPSMRARLAAVLALAGNWTYLVLAGV